MKTISQDDVRRFKRLGYLVVRNVFSVREVDQIRDSLRNLCEEGKYSAPGDLLNHEELGRLVYDERMVGIGKALMGDEIAYYGDSGFAYSSPPVRGFHPDDPPNVIDQLANRFQPRHVYDAYGLVRLGIFPQDQTAYSGGFKIREQTHMHVSLTQFLRLFAGSTVHYVRQLLSAVGTKSISRPFPSVKLIRRCKMVNVRSRIGDVVAWDLRTLHSPWAIRLKGFPNLPLSPDIENRVPRALEMDRPANRSRVTITYGVASEFLDRQMKHLGSRTDYAERHWDACTWNKEEMADLLRKNGLELRLDCFDYRHGKLPEIKS